MDRFVKKIGKKWIEYPLDIEIAFQKFEEWSHLDRTTICGKLGITLPENMPDVKVIISNSDDYHAS